MTRHYDAHIKLEVEDYLAFCKLYSRLTRPRRIGSIIHGIIDVALFVVAAICWWQGEWGLAIYFLGLGLFLLALRFWIGPMLRRRQSVSQHLGDHEIELSADESGLTLNSAISNSTHKWASIRQVNDLPGHIVLWPNNRIGFIVPKRAFATSDDALGFLQLAKEKTTDQKL